MPNQNKASYFILSYRPYLDWGFHNRILNKMSSLTYNSNRTRVHYGGFSLKLPCSKLLGSNVHDNHMHAGSK